MGNEGDDWKALTSDPNIFNNLCTKLGFDTNKHGVVFQDLFAMEDWAYEMTMPPHVGVLMCIDFDKVAGKENDNSTPKDQVPADLFYMHQISKNACGSVGLYHILGNARSKYPFEEGSVLDNFFKTDRSDWKSNADQFHGDKALKSQHQVSVKQTTLGGDENEVFCHFIAFVEHNGIVWELDGRKKGPICRGATTYQSFLSDVGGIVKKEYVDPNPDLKLFSLMTVAGKPLD